MPDPSADVLLAQVAQRSEQLREASSDAHKKQWSQYLTPPAIAAFMAELLDLERSGERRRILDPGAGTGILGLTLAHRLLTGSAARVELVAVEPETEAAGHLDASLADARRRYGPRLTSRRLPQDLRELADDALEPFDLVIANPPYRKLPAAAGVPNIYALFMRVALQWLRPGGKMCFLIPRSFASGSYYKKFRAEIFGAAFLERVHVFGSRKDAFRADGVLQETIVVVLRRRRDPDEAQPASVEISSSVGTADLGDSGPVALPYDEVVGSTDAATVIRLPTSPADRRVAGQVGRWTGRLADFGLAVSTGPVVPFRARHLLSRQPGKPRAPLIWLNHVHPDGVVHWPLGELFKKEEYIDLRGATELGVAPGNYVLVRRFSSKEERRRLTAASLFSRQLLSQSRIGIENHVNFIHRPGITMKIEEARGMTALLNSSVMDQYFRIVSGNTQVSATELRALPMPALATITEIGRRVARAGDHEETVRELLEM